MNKNMVIALGALVILGGGYLVYASTAPSPAKNEGGGMAQEQMEGVAKQEDGEMEKVNDEQMPGEDMQKTGTYEAYSEEKVAMAENGDVVLFFHASWCPSCRALNSDIEKNLSSIPAGVTILKVDYDKEAELEKKYGVTSQHTLVQVDKDGNLIKKWSGGSKLENLLSKIE